MVWSRVQECFALSSFERWFSGMLETCAYCYAQECICILSLCSIAFRHFGKISYFNTNFVLKASRVITIKNGQTMGLIHCVCLCARLNAFHIIWNGTKTNIYFVKCIVSSLIHAIDFKSMVMGKAAATATTNTVWFHFRVVSNDSHSCKMHALGFHWRQRRPLLLSTNSQLQ